MPIYEYACPICKARFERLRSMQDSDTVPCPDCGTQARRALSLFAVPARGSVASDMPAASGAVCCGSGACSCASS